MKKIIFFLLLAALLLPGQAIAIPPATPGLSSSGDGGSLTNLDGDNIQNDTIDDDSIDFADVTCADLTMTDCTQAISDNTVVTVDHASAADNDFAKFTANGLEGRSYSETRDDIGAQQEWVTQSFTTASDPDELVIAAGANVRVNLTVHAADVVLTLEETNAADMKNVFICNVSANDFSMADSAAVVEILPTVVATDECLPLQYRTDRYVNPYVTKAISFASFTLPTTTSGDQTLTAGMIGLKTDEDYIVTHGGANGQVTTEVAVPLFTDKEWSFDPDAVCDLTTDRLFLMTVDHPHGITILEWKLSFDVDPTTEWGAGETLLKYADAFIGVANTATIDDLASTSGVASESTIGNINSGAAVANGKVIYIDFPTAYTEALHQVVFEMRYKIEED